ncbi:UDPGP type 1 family protein [Candidatus Woesearchaeota archaeon]|nr:UDPGP type 1 family protein [Candidatus Woesearchaeota archaeon]
MIKYPAEYQTAVENVYKAKQEHIFSQWNKLTSIQKKELLDSVSDIDFKAVKERFDSLKSRHDEKKHLEPAEAIEIPKTQKQKNYMIKALNIGRKYLRKGKVAAFLVAGGQGSRLGFEGPKGCFKISPVKKKSLFQLQAEKIYAIQKKYSTIIPWYIMTSSTNDADTKNFFKENKYFGLSPNNIMFFKQKEIPAVDENGNIILETKCRVFKNPNGHGGSILALHESGALNDMKKRGIKEIFYYQVDNALVKMLDPVFVGCHVLAKAQMSSKMVKKTNPEEKVGILGYINGKMGVIEYSEMSDAEMKAKKGNELKFNAGNIAIHMLNVKFVEELNKGGFKLPYHKAVKKIPAYAGEVTGIKFETFVFDALKYAKSSVIMEVKREEEFAPVKNKDGADSPETALDMQNRMYARWLEYAYINIPRDENGRVQGNIEICPHYALDPSELRKRLDLEFKFSKGSNVYLDF